MTLLEVPPLDMAVLDGGQRSHIQPFGSVTTPSQSPPWALGQNSRGVSDGLKQTMCHFSTNHGGQEDGVPGPTWVSCSPWAVQGCGCQDLRGCQAVNPLRPRSRARSPPAPRIHLDMGSVYPPRALAVRSFAARGIPSPSQLGTRCP